jgi:glycosyltransferase involved in cell wall biosynthesis
MKESRGERPNQSLGRILIIVENLPVPFDRRVWMEATALTRSGYDVFVICPTGKGYELHYEEINGIHIYRHDLPTEVSNPLGYLREYASALLAQFRLALRINRRHGIDVIHACNPPDLMFLVAAWFKVFHGTRFVFDHHDLSPELYESKFGRRDIFYHGLRIAERLTFALTDIVISTNQSYRDIALTRGRKRPGDVHIVRSGPDLARFSRVPPNQAFRRGRRHLVGYLGVMGEFDGVDHLVRAAHQLVHARGRKDIQFCLIGSGPMLPSLKVLATDLNVADCIEFTGRIPDDELIERLSSCDVCVNPDPANPLNEKSTMNKVLEYMALERPIVQYDLAEGRYSAGNASLYATPNDISSFAEAIECLLADKRECERMGAFGRFRMESELEWKHQIPRLLAAYDSVLHNGVSRMSKTHIASEIKAEVQSMM